MGLYDRMVRFLLPSSDPQLSSQEYFGILIGFRSHKSNWSYRTPHRQFILHVLVHGEEGIPRTAWWSLSSSSAKRRYLLSPCQLPRNSHVLTMLPVQGEFKIYQDSPRDL